MITKKSAASFTQSPKSFRRPPLSVSIYFLIAGWTVVILGLAAWTWIGIYSNTVTLARREAYKGYEKDVMLRAWATTHGGVYVPVTKETQPNPYLSDTKERDIVTPSHRTLTLLNPAYITRQVHELSFLKHGIIGHITSLDPLRKENRADGWETGALFAFEKGVKEYYGFDTIGHALYYRYMAPLVADEGCLNCHAVQGYKLGDIRGGISSAVPWEEYHRSIVSQVRKMLLGYSLLWVIGFIGLSSYNKRIMHYLAQRDLVEKERENAESALRRSERLLREAQDVAHLGYYVTDLTTGMWESSPVLDEILGIDESFVRDLDHWGTIIAPDHRAEMIEYFHDVLTEKSRFNMDYKIIRVNDGQERWVSAMGEFELDESGTPIRQIGTIQDITDRKHLEHQLIQSQKLEGVGTLAGGIAHDFNNLLAMILGSAEKLRGQLAANPELKKYADRIVDASERGASISRQLLIFSRPNEAELKPISLSQTVRGLKDMLKHFLPRSIAIVTAAEANNGRILGDAGQIHQALLNLSLNAGDAMANAGTLTFEEYTVSPEFIRSRFGHDASVPYVAVSVADTGSGMDEALIKNIFDPFFSTKERGKGTGLGLAIVHGIVKSHNGFIGVESTPGTGTTFTLYFPSHMHEEKKEPAIVVRSEVHQSGTILLVDDEELLREMIADFLVERGFSVTQASNGSEALQLYESMHASIDLVITDLGMPEMGGEELYRRLRSINPDVTVIVSSGYLDGTTRNDLLTMGILKVLTKPFKMQDIQQAVGDALSARVPPPTPSRPA
jgi:PAS domain S-box-containing protein